MGNRTCARSRCGRSPYATSSTLTYHVGYTAAIIIGSPPSSPSRTTDFVLDGTERNHRASLVGHQQSLVLISVDTARERPYHSSGAAFEGST